MPRSRLPEGGPLAELAARLGERPTPHELAILADPAHQLGFLPWGLRERLAALWTPTKVAALSTEEICTLLASWGVTVDRESFVALARGRERAWAIAEEIWLPPARERGEVPDNLLGLAAVELWKRWIPERPGRDVLGSWVAEGYRLLEHDRNAACEHWLRTWDTLRWRLGLRPTLAAAREMVDGGPELTRWLLDLGWELCVAVAGSPALGPRAVAYLEATARLQLPQGEAWVRHCLRTDLADVLFHIGRREEGERVHRTLIRGPGSALERRRLAEALAYSADVCSAEELERATALLEVVPDYGVGLGEEAEAHDRLACLQEHPPLEPAPPVARLAQVGMYLPTILEERILAASDAVVPELLALVEQGIEAEDESRGQWAAVHAVKLLGERHDARVVEPAVRFLGSCAPDWNAANHAVGGLGRLGRAGLEPLLAAHAAATDPYIRRALREAVAELDLNDPRILELLVRGLDESPGWAALDLLQHNDERAIPFIQRRLDQGCDEGDARSLEHALEELQGLDDEDTAPVWA